VPFGDVGWGCGIAARASDHASCLVSSDLRFCFMRIWGLVFVGHHERSVMCRLAVILCGLVFIADYAHY
jgi:hypothetical protein